MTKLSLSLTALVLAAACGDRNESTAPALANPVAAAPKPTGPSFDNIRNTLDNSVDAAAEVMALNSPGGNGTTEIVIIATKDDGENGCNLKKGATITLAVESDKPGVANVSPQSITFSACDAPQTLTVTPVAPGAAAISVRQTASTVTSGTFQFATATFTVNVTAPPNTAPTVAVAGVAHGGKYNKGEVPAATCEVTDAEDGKKSFPATLSAVAGDYATDGIGTQQASCSYKDNGGLTASTAATYSIIDPSAPTIGSTLSPATPDGLDGWYKGAVNLTWSITEAESPNSLQKTGCEVQAITTDQAPTTYTCSATSAGGSASGTPVTIKRDGTAPTISGAATTSANANGWYNSNVTVKFTCADATPGSGVATCEPDVTLASDGANQKAEGNASDKAGNAATPATVSGINIDKTKPTVSFAGGPAAGTSHVFGSVPAAPSCSASDALSGLDGSCAISGYSTLVGTHTVTARATDKAGNTETATLTYTVLPWTLKGFYAPVNMKDANGNEIINTIRAGQAVALKFNAYAGTTEKTETAAVQKFSATQIACSASASTDPVEITNTGSTSLRYDATAAQFIQNWATPKTANACYRVSIVTLDGSSLTAVFQTK